MDEAHTRLTRRTLLAGLAGAVGVATLSAACGVPAPGSTQSASRVGASAGNSTGNSSGALTSVSFGGGDISGVLNPLLAGTARPLSLLYEGLVALDRQTGMPIPNLAQTWDLAPDGLSWTFHMRPDIKWSDGQPMTADDVKFTFDIGNDPKIPTTVRGVFTNVAGYDAPDPATFRVSLKTPECPFLVNTMLTAIVPKHLLAGSADIATDEFNNRPVGSGPFRFKEWVRGSYLTLEANQYYWQGRPKVDQWIYRVLPNQNNVINALKLGDIDYSRIQPDAIDELQREPNLNLISIDAPDNLTFIAYNLDRPLFTDTRVRQALTRALDRKSIVDSQLYGQGVVLESPIPPISWGYASTLPPVPYDVDAARKLMSDAGWAPGADGILTKDGTRMAFTLTTSQSETIQVSVATIVQDAWKKLGVDMQIRVLETGAYRTNYAQQGPKDFDAIIVGGGVIAMLDPDQTKLLASTQYPAGGNFMHYASPTVDRLLAEARAVPGCDLAARKALYLQMQQVLADDQPFSPLYAARSTLAINKRLLNVTTNPWTSSPYILSSIKDWTVNS